MTMSVSDTQQTLQAYAEALLTGGDFAQSYSDDVVAIFEGTDQRYEGRDAVRDMIRAATDMGQIRARGVFAGEGHAVIEADFIHQNGSSVPYAVVYDLADGKITALRLYFTSPIFSETAQDW